MRHFRIQEKDNSQRQRQTNRSFNERLLSSLTLNLKNIPFIEFVVNYGYAIENVWVTMLMIVHKTPDLLDSFIWITPIIIAVLIRPYIIRFIHKIKLKVYREINVITFFLMLGGIGCFLVGYSCQKFKKQHKIWRILLCSLGWTLMDISFQFCLYFSQKLKQGYQELKQKVNFETKKQQIVQIQKSNFYNFSLYGLLAGYVVSLIICIFVSGKSINDFYRCAKFAYFTAGIVSIVLSLRLFLQSKLNMPKADLEIKSSISHKQQKRKEKALKKASQDISYYLPGFYELQFSDTSTFSLLLVHACVVLLNDIVLIYTTMWFAQIYQPSFKKEGQSLIYGLQIGSIALIGYTVIDNLNLRAQILSNRYLLNILFTIITILAFFAFIKYNNIFIIFFILTVAIMNHFYRNVILDIQSQRNSLFQRCIEIIERFQKIFVLCIFPFIPLIILQRDDIVDCLILSSLVSLASIVIYIISEMKKKSNLLNQDSIVIKINKIESSNKDL